MSDGQFLAFALGCFFYGLAMGAWLVAWWIMRPTKSNSNALILLKSEEEVVDFKDAEGETRASIRIVE